MSSEERIRRAEEIYNRRRERYNGNVRVSSSSVNVNSKPEYAMYKKLVLQVLVCLLIYIVFYLIKNSDYIFSRDVLEKTNDFLTYDINFQNVYETVGGYYNNVRQWLDGFNEQNNEVNKEQGDNANIVEGSNNSNNLENVNSENSSEENNTKNLNEVSENNKEQSEDSEKQEEVMQTSQTGGIGGGTDNDDLIQEDEPTPQVQLSQMEIDANEIRQNYNIVIPLKGTITSRYGPREATQIVSGNHKGIDIAVNEGTVFYSAMDGTVTEVSGEGSYGNHIYIQNGDVVTLYAHCKTIYLQKGQQVSQGMQIGEVGSTGNVTGPHLHFEIRKEGRVINPEYILSF